MAMLCKTLFLLMTFRMSVSVREQKGQLQRDVDFLIASFVGIKQDIRNLYDDLTSFNRSMFESKRGIFPMDETLAREITTEDSCVSTCTSPTDVFDELKMALTLGLQDEKHFVRNQIDSFSKQLSDFGRSISDMESLYESKVWNEVKKINKTTQKTGVELRDQIQQVSADTARLEANIDEESLQINTVKEDIVKIKEAQNTFKEQLDKMYKGLSMANAKVYFKEHDLIHYKDNVWYKHIKDQKLTWEDARQHCHDMGGFLADVEDIQDYDFLKNMMAGFDDGYDRVWVGANNQGEEGNWRWESSEQPLVDWLWCRNEPNNLQGYEFCGELRYFHSEKCINDHYCTNTITFLCEFQQDKMLDAFIKF